MASVSTRQDATIAIIGNCQARPLGLIISAVLPGVTVLDPVIAHLGRPENAAADLERLAAADIILSQPISEFYPVEHARTSVLRSHFGDKVVLWHNLYYRGYNPELVYYRHIPNKPGRFPLGDYHISTVAEGYRDGIGVDDVLQRLTDEDFNREKYAGVAAKSLEELRLREAECLIDVVDDIAEREAAQQLFFTFNHPTLHLLADYTHRLLEALDFRPEIRIVPGMMPEPLGMLVLPSNPIARFATPSPRTYRIPPPPGSGGRLNLSTERNLVENYYSAYDALPREVIDNAVK